MCVLVVGSVNRDYRCRVSDIPRAGETVIALKLGLGSGGKGGNQAVACAKLGANTYLVACVGDDPYGHALLADLNADGVDTEDVLVSDTAHTGMAFVMVAADGENSIVVAPGANGELEPQHIRTAVKHRLGAGDVLVTQTEIPLACVEAALDEAQRIGARVVLNLAPYVDVPTALLQACDPLVVNEVEAQSLLGIGATEVVDPFEMAERLGRLTRSAVITIGPQGALVTCEGTVHRVPAETAEVVDSTGAGDAFTGALAAGLCAGMDLLSAVRRGVAAGTYAVARLGTQPSYPGPDDLP